MNEIANATPIIYTKDNGLKTKTESTINRLDIVLDKTIETMNSSIEEKINDNPVIIPEWK